MENAFHPDLNTHIGYYYWQIASQRLGDRPGNEIFSSLSSSLYLAHNVQLTAFLEDMVDFFAYIRCGSQIRL
jgi:hypothetical protein